MFSLGILLQKWAKILALVLAGFPTTTILQFCLANLSKFNAWVLKILPFYINKSFLSIPLVLGLAPTRIAISQSLNPTYSSLVISIDLIKGLAVSYNSYIIPLSFSNWPGSSKRHKWIHALFPSK